MHKDGDEFVPSGLRAERAQLATWAENHVVADAESREFEGVAVWVASPATLIRTKQTPRPQDALDRAFLAEVIRDRDAGIT